MSAATLKVTVILFALTVSGVAAIKPKADDDDKFTNLKVLAKDISDEEMERVMFTFERQLGVTCLYCHVAAKKGVFPPRVDFASDDKPEKKIAREMLRMTLKLNKKYFQTDVGKKMIVKPVIWCRTCHLGFPRPPNSK